MHKCIYTYVYLSDGTIPMFLLILIRLRFYWGSRDGGYEWGRHHRTMASPNRPMEQLVPSGEISDGESNLVTR